MNQKQKILLIAAIGFVVSATLGLWLFKYSNKITIDDVGKRVSMSGEVVSTEKNNSASSSPTAKLASVVVDVDGTMLNVSIVNENKECAQDAVTSVSEVKIGEVVEFLGTVTAVNSMEVCSNVDDFLVISWVRHLDRTWDTIEEQ